jgi:hypothetical protein
MLQSVREDPQNTFTVTRPPDARPHCGSILMSPILISCSCFAGLSACQISVWSTGTLRDLHKFAARQRHLEACTAFIGDLLEPRLDGGRTGDPRQAFALERDELGAQGVALLEQLVRRRRAAAGGGCHLGLQVEESLRKIKKDSCKKCSATPGRIAGFADLAEIAAQGSRAGARPQGPIPCVCARKSTGSTGNQ